MAETRDAALSLGGNVGDVVESFRHALGRLAETPGLTVTALSSVWRTKAWGKTDQPDFLNMAARLAVTISPRDLLDLCLSIEKERGRERNERWGPRTLDLDVLYYEAVEMDEAGLTLPHPRLAERAFVLAPLAQVARDVVIGGASVRNLLLGANLGGVAVDREATERLTAPKGAA